MKKTYKVPTEQQRELTDAVIQHYQENQIPIRTIKPFFDPEVTQAVYQFIFKIEEAHRNAGNSKLVFKCLGALT